MLIIEVVHVMGDVRDVVEGNMLLAGQGGAIVGGTLRVLSGSSCNSLWTKDGLKFG